VRISGHAYNLEVQFLVPGTTPTLKIAQMDQMRSVDSFIVLWTDNYGTIYVFFFKDIGLKLFLCVLQY
jgi:hypothetical protein